MLNGKLWCRPVERMDYVFLWGEGEHILLFILWKLKANVLKHIFMNYK